MISHGNDDICAQETIQEYDFDKDGKLNTAEYHQVLLLFTIATNVFSFLLFWRFLTTGNGAGGKWEYGWWVEL